VVVGAGISGLSVAHFFRKALAGPQIPISTIMMTSAATPSAPISSTADLYRSVAP
jgi:hypothetical protein